MLSAREIKRRSMVSAVFKEAWRYKRRTILFTLSIGTSLKLAWKTVRSYTRVRHSKVAGVLRKQHILRRLLEYNPEDIILYFNRQYENLFDLNAIVVMAAVKGKGKVSIGYVRKELAQMIAPLLDTGYQALVILDRITGAGPKGLLGLNFSYIIV